MKRKPDPEADGESTDDRGNDRTNRDVSGRESFIELALTGFRWDRLLTIFFRVVIGLAHAGCRRQGHR
jgi:hypothetical protein